MSTSNKEYEKKLNIALEIYKDISRQIQFADTKAGLILAWHGASLGFLSKIVTDKLQEITSVGLKVLTLTFFGCSLILALLSDVNLIDEDVKINKGTNGRFSKQTAMS